MNFIRRVLFILAFASPIFSSSSSFSEDSKDDFGLVELRMSSSEEDYDVASLSAILVDPVSDQDAMEDSTDSGYLAFNGSMHILSRIGAAWMFQFFCSTIFVVLGVIVGQCELPPCRQERPMVAAMEGVGIISGAIFSAVVMYVLQSTYHSFGYRGEAFYSSLAAAFSVMIIPLALLIVDRCYSDVAQWAIPPALVGATHMLFSIFGPVIAGFFHHLNYSSEVQRLRKSLGPKSLESSGSHEDGDDSDHAEEEAVREVVEFDLFGIHSGDLKNLIRSLGDSVKPKLIHDLLASPMINSLPVPEKARVIDTLFRTQPHCHRHLLKYLCDVFRHVHLNDFDDSEGTGVVKHVVDLRDFYFACRMVAMAMDLPLELAGVIFKSYMATIRVHNIDVVQE